MKRTIDEIIDNLISETKTNDRITSKLFDKNNEIASSNFISRQSGVVSGIRIAQSIYRKLSNKVTFQILKDEGSYVNRGDVLAVITGPVSEILKGEIISLNFVRYLSGVSSITNKYLLELNGLKCDLVYSNHTSPIYQDLIKKAFIDGGGKIYAEKKYYNVSRNLSTRFNNYQEVVDKIRKIDNEITIICEVDDAVSFKEAKEANPDIIRICTTKENILKECLQIGYKNVEAYGDFDLKKVRSIAKLGLKALVIPSLTAENNNLNIDLCFYKRLKNIPNKNN